MPSRIRSTALTTVATGLTAALLLTGCSDEPESATSPAEATTTARADTLLSAHGLEGKDARTLIDELDATPVAERSSEFMAAIQVDRLVISDGSGATTSLALPTEEFYVSIAPFVDQTHECFFHSLTTCRGELANQAIDVEVIDDSGTVLVDETMTTFDNGFLGLWLPRDISATVTLEANGRTVTDTLSTGADDPTCVTTLQLV
ncbi:hypothetical protein FNH13_03905 [Ornithinimicrobium ciconiae]|uniref:CueP family metal-binding protein n=1 Tax=Ornithinimicrobium ciconiae TaxID=2594265 RepID=A0A516G7S9_9MICO|nr:CueP family metal-binding protein [Ornithinimicrobium ciconiae]QDO87584.1 hypothetical protein FNH13_03905 [Ornithinimicrobium ciconiae]